MVTRGDAAVLPEDPHDLAPGALSRGGTVAALLGTALVTVGFAVGMWFVPTDPPPGSGTVWFIGWNLFPLLFTLPVTVTCGYFLSRSRRSHAFVANYDRLRRSTTHVEGILREVAAKRQLLE
ncbi:hypothetical protein OCAE111667_14230 [Occultella aeris]|uniref:Uncharacterized protein n=1 Tax=Occultella aeris TaxID=2761496 RepID=A0A7M4DIT1_9MICO|nr:hypothetical protein HALOF300_02034 [Occultella aeris]